MGNIKNPGEFIVIDQMYNECYNNLTNNRVSRYSKAYVSYLTNTLSEYLGKPIVLDKNEIVKILKDFSKRHKRMIEILNMYTCDYSDIKKEYVNMSKIISKYNEQRYDYRINSLIDPDIVSSTLKVEMIDASFYRNKIIKNYLTFLEVLKAKMIGSRKQVKMQEIYIKILKYFINELNFTYNYYFV